MKVYALFCGEYSDRTLNGIFSSLEALQAGKARMDRSNHYGDWNDPEEYEVDEVLSFEHGPTWLSIIDLKSGKIIESDRDESLRHPERVTISETVPGFSMPAIYVTSPISREHATKIAAEKRQEWLRNQVNARPAPSLPAASPSGRA